MKAVGEAVGCGRDGIFPLESGVEVTFLARCVWPYARCVWPYQFSGFWLISLLTWIIRRRFTKPAACCGGDECR